MPRPPSASWPRPPRPVGDRRGPRSGARPARPREDADLPGDGWIWGRHAAAAALANAARTIHTTYATRNLADQLHLAEGVYQLSAPGELDALLPPGAVHQGVALRVDALTPTPLDALAAPAEGLLVMLDQVTDPHNVGAVIRSCAAFGGRGLILQDRKAPPFTGACAKAAVGAAERMPHARVVNLSRTLDTLREAGWRCIGLAGAASDDLETALGPARAEQQAQGERAGDDHAGIVLVLGSEDKGLRPSVAGACDTLARIPIAADVESLNISTAAAVALYAARAALTGGPPPAPRS